jgi:kynureninase
MQACIAAGVVGDFRAPDIMRFGFTPLFIDARDVTEAIDRIATVMREERWKDPAFQTRAAVT